MIGFGKTDVGLVRQNNEDSIFVSNEPVGILPNLYIVSDGMGGHNAGEIASSHGISFFCDAVKDHGSRKENNDDILDILVEGVSGANKSVYAISLQSSAMNGMGATFSACVVANSKLYVAHVGDSRVYVIKKDDIRQITSDHSYVNEMMKAGEITQEEAKNHPRRNIITRALGTNEDIDVDGVISDVCDGDFVLICSDGLSNMLSDQDMLRLVQADGDVCEKCDGLIQLAKQNGGDDNVSVILVLINEVKA